MNHSNPENARILISETYRQLNRELHQREPMYGTTARRYVERIRDLALRHQVRSILDYGCGKRDLWTALHGEFGVCNFDPAIPGLDESPEPADLVACIDVLEHVEPGCLENVLIDLARVMRKVGFLSIATQPSGKTLSDGRNCHRIIEEPAWWIDRLEKHFELQTFATPLPKKGLELVVRPSLPSAICCDQTG